MFINFYILYFIFYILYFIFLKCRPHLTTNYNWLSRQSQHNISPVKQSIATLPSQRQQRGNPEFKDTTSGLPQDRAFTKQV